MDKDHTLNNSVFSLVITRNMPTNHLHVYIHKRDRQFHDKLVGIMKDMKTAISESHCRHQSVYSTFGPEAFCCWLFDKKFSLRGRDMTTLGWGKGEFLGKEKWGKVAFSFLIKPSSVNRLPTPTPSKNRGGT
jgi:hypothetical protein